MGRLRSVARRLEVRGAPPPTATFAETFLTNEDLAPVRPDKRTWNTLDFAAFWIADGANLNTFTIAATSVTNGLTWWQGWLSVIVGYTLIACVVVLQSRGPAAYHIGFPVFTRSSFGIFGSIWPVFQRAVMACIWQGVQAYLGGECVTLCLRAIWPSYTSRPSLAKGFMNNQVTGYGVLSFVLFNLFTFAFLLPAPQQIRWLFRVKALVTPVAMFGLMIWVLADAHGGGQALTAPSQVSGSRLGWLWVTGCMSCVSNMATLSVNMPDFARMATSVKATQWSQMIAMPTTFMITSLIGVIISSASESIYGKKYWNPLDVMGAKLDKEPHNPKARTGVFFIAFMFIIVQIGTNIAANSLSAGSDLTALVSRYINIRRGSVVCWIVGFAYCPWVIMNSSSNFQTYLSSFSVFLSSVAGVMVADYYIVVRGYIRVPALYKLHISSPSCSFAPTNSHSDGMMHVVRSPYLYGRLGCNWRAYAAYLVGLAVNMPGFVQVCGSNRPNPLIQSQGLSDFYQLAYPVGFFVSGLAYVLINQVRPAMYAVPLQQRKEWREPESRSWEMPDWSISVWDMDGSEEKNWAPSPRSNDHKTDIESCGRSEGGDVQEKDLYDKEEDVNSLSAKPTVTNHPYRPSP